MPEPPSGRRCANPSACPRWCSPRAIWGSARSPTAAQFPLWAALLSTLTIFALPGPARDARNVDRRIGAGHDRDHGVAHRGALPADDRRAPADAALARADSPWRIYAAVHLAGDDRMGRQHAPLPAACRAQQRLPWFVGFALTNWVCLPRRRLRSATCWPIRCRRSCGRGWCSSDRCISCSSSRARRAPAMACRARLRRGRGSAGPSRVAAMERAAGRAASAAPSPGPHRRRCGGRSNVLELALLVVACGLATYLWRGLGMLISGKVRMDSEFFVWAGCVAYAMIAGLTVRIILLPTGTLAATLAVGAPRRVRVRARRLFRVPPEPVRGHRDRLRRARRPDRDPQRVLIRRSTGPDGTQAARAFGLHDSGARGSRRPRPSGPTRRAPWRGRATPAARTASRARAR